MPRGLLKPVAKTDTLEDVCAIAANAASKTIPRTTNLKVFIQGVLPSSTSSSWQFVLQSVVLKFRSDDAPKQGLLNGFGLGERRVIGPKAA
jgi:hypothetical protein